MEELEKSYGVKIQGLLIAVWFISKDSAKKFVCGFKHARRNKDFVDLKFNDNFIQRGYDFYFKLWYYLKLSNREQKLIKARPFVIAKLPKSKENEKNGDPC